MTVHRTESDLTILLRACLRGDERAWRDLVDRYSALIWTITRSHRLSPTDSQDVYQLTWLRVVQHLSKLRTPELFEKWITTTARRECLKHIERNRRHVPVGDSAVLEHPHGEVEAPDEAALRTAGDGRVWCAFRRLPQRDQALLGTLLTEPVPTYDEVSRTLGLPRGSIGPLRRRALTRLRDLLPATLAA